MTPLTKWKWESVAMQIWAAWRHRTIDDLCWRLHLASANSYIDEIMGKKR